MADLRFPINERDHVLGEATARVTLVEYGDYQCPHCQAAQPHVERVLRQFGRDLLYAYRHFPLTTVHPMAKPAAETAEFAGAHGRFWQMHTALFANGAQLSGPVLLALAEQVDLALIGHFPQDFGGVLIVDALRQAAAHIDAFAHVLQRIV